MNIDARRVWRFYFMLRTGQGSIDYRAFPKARRIWQADKRELRRRGGTW